MPAPSGGFCGPNAEHLERLLGKDAWEGLVWTNKVTTESLRHVPADVRQLYDWLQGVEPRLDPVWYGWGAVKPPGICPMARVQCRVVPPLVARRHNKVSCHVELLKYVITRTFSKD